MLCSAGECAGERGRKGASWPAGTACYVDPHKMTILSFGRVYSAAATFDMEAAPLRCVGIHFDTEATPLRCVGTRFVPGGGIFIKNESK